MTAERCPLCSARTLATTLRTLRYEGGTVRGFRWGCETCGLLGDDAAAAKDALGRALAGPIYRAEPADPFGLDAYTLRSAASRCSRCIVPIGPEQTEALRQPHSPLAAHARIVDLPRESVPVSFGLLCRPADLEGVLQSIGAHAAWASDVAILVSEPAPPRTVPVDGFAPGAVRVAGRALSDDFAAQRNALAAMSRNRWMLQLDADETLDPAVGARLGAFARIAEADDVVSIGLPRRNFVAGVLANVFPDIQYRLNRRDVLFSGRVHERPERPWQASMILLHGTIDHHLSREHVESRSRRYEAIEPGRGRLGEENALLVPYRD